MYQDHFELLDDPCGGVGTRSVQGDSPSIYLYKSQILSLTDHKLSGITERITMEIGTQLPQAHRCSLRKSCFLNSVGFVILTPKSRLFVQYYL